MNKVLILLAGFLVMSWAGTSLTGAQLQNLTDNIGWQYDKIDTLVGFTGTAGTFLYGLQQNIDSVNTYSEDAQADLYKSAVYEKTAILSWKYNLNKYLVRGIENHLRRITGTGVSDFWQDSLTTRLAPGFAKVARNAGVYIEDSIVFPFKTCLAMGAITASHTIIVRDSNAIDLSLYGDANLLVLVKNAATTCTCSLTVTGKDRHGASITGLANISGKADGDTVLVVQSDGLKFYNVTNLTVRNGTNLDTLVVKTRYDRALAQ